MTSGVFQVRELSYSTHFQIIKGAKSSGQWAVGSGQWAVGSGQWAVGSGPVWQK